MTLEERVQKRTAQLAQANTAIQDLNARLKAENLSIAARLDLVRQIQERILPKPTELNSLRDLEVAAYMAAAEDVGGDYYDVLVTEEGVTIAMGDVTGHGLESGLIMLMTQTAVRTLTELGQISPQIFLNTLNRTLYKNIQRLDTYKNLTLVLLHYNQGQVKITGQHEEVVIMRANGTVERVDTIDLGFPLGLEPDILAFLRTHTVTLEPADGLVLFSDGIVEAMDGAKQLYGFDRFCGQLQRHWNRPVVEIEAAIVADVQAHLGGEMPLDDMSLLILKRLS
ncbi:MAG: PP2C family protein-serine/threonine phosphatase [Prochlorothrix sp.]|nr:PP2C family protein-serine/threonine phosphatase [Prochlorothrix sp.]